MTSTTSTLDNLATAENRQALLNGVAGAVFIHDLKGQILEVNEQARHLYGMSDAEITPMSLLTDLSSESCSPTMFETYWQQAVAGQPQLFEWQARRPATGQIFEVEIHLKKIQLPANESEAFIVTNVRDINIRKQAEQERNRLLAEAERRAVLLQTASEIGRAASMILDVPELIETAVNLIRDRFDFYYVGLFLVELLPTSEQATLSQGEREVMEEWAVLKAGTGKAGKVQLARQHKLAVGGSSMIGWSVANHLARIALDVGEEAVRFKNPDLPLTRSEMALPLVSRDEALGALTVQSTLESAFSPEDITLLQTMADQLANAIKNAQLFERVAQAQQEAEQRLQEMQALQSFSQALAATLDLAEIIEIFCHRSQQQTDFGYLLVVLVQNGTERVELVHGVGLTTEELSMAQTGLSQIHAWRRVFHNGQTEHGAGLGLNENEGMAVITPIGVGKRPLGLVVAGYRSHETQIQPEQIKLLRTFIDQATLAIDNAGRYAASQRVARREALLKEITTKVRASTEVETILQTTVQEVSRAIGQGRAFIQLG